MAEINKEYAAALFALAAERGKEEEVLCGLRLLRRVYEITPGMADFLTSPAISEKVRLSAAEQAFGNDLPELVLSFLALLCRKRKVEQLPLCVGEYEKIYAESRREAHATVTSAVALTDHEKERLCASLQKRSGRRVAVQYALDETLLGGVIVDLDGEILDGSLRRRLQSVKEAVEGTV